MEAHRLGVGQQAVLLTTRYGLTGSFDADGKLALSKIGHLKSALHRPLQGRVKTCCVRRSQAQQHQQVVRHLRVCRRACGDPGDQPVGIDVGLNHFVTLSTGQTIEHPRFLRTDERALAKVQRRLSGEAKDTPEHSKRRKPVARVHERLRFRRHDFAHQDAGRLVDRFSVIAVEDREINRMVHHRCLCKSIHDDAAWDQFNACLAAEAASAGRAYVAVNPA